MNLVQQFNALSQEDRVIWANRAATGLEKTPGFIGILVYEDDQAVICFKVDKQGEIWDAIAMSGKDCLSVVKQIDEHMYQTLKTGLN